MKDHTKKRLVIAGLAVVCVLAVFGISRVLYKEPVQTVENGEKAKEEIDLVVEPEDTAKEDIKEKEAADALVIEPETESTAESGVQSIQPEPEKTEEEKPQEKPELSEETDITNPNEKPSAPEEKPQENPTKTDNSNPSHGDTKDGMIYIDGFGWVTDNGGGGSGSSAEDMYENGNKVGIMD